MKLFKSDISLMRWNILAIFASALIGATALYCGEEYVERTRKDLHNALNTLNDAHNRLAAAHQDQESMAIYADEYGALNKNKIIGDDQRLDWIEGLEKIRQRHLVTDFRYDIAPQKIYAPQSPIDSGNFDIHYSAMKLRFNLLHEAQLLDFFDALNRQIKGRYQLEGCALQRAASNENGGVPTATAIKAECDGGWITLKNRNIPQ